MPYQCSVMIVDIVVIAAILVSALIAFLRGFIRETLTIVGVAGGLLAAVYGGPLLEPVIAGWFAAAGEGGSDKLLGVLPFDMLATGLAYGSIFLVIVIVLSVMSFFLSDAAESIGLGPIDRTLGVLFGIVRAVLLLGLLYLPFHLLMGDKQKQSWFGDAHSYVYLEWTAAWMAGFLPDGTESALEKKAAEIRKAPQGAGEAAREKLKELDLLKQEQAPVPAEEGGGAPGDGYQDDTREQMNRLFEEELNE